MLISSIDLQQRWIPVTERVPDIQEESSLEYCGFERSDMVLVTIDNPFGANETDTACFYRDTDGDEWWGTEEGNFDLDVVAWMPLPEPYVGTTVCFDYVEEVKHHDEQEK